MDQTNDSFTAERPATRTTRRRRIAALAGALTLLTSAGVAAVTSVSVADTVSPPIGDTLPQPRPLDATALDQATRGWVNDWEVGRASISTDLLCAGSVDGSRPRPVDQTTRQFRVGSRVGATLTVQRYGDVDQAHDSPAWLIDPKCEGEAWSLGDEIWDGGDSVGIRVSARGQTFQHIVVVHETQVASLTVVGAGHLPETTRRRIVRTMIADLLG